MPIPRAMPEMPVSYSEIQREDTKLEKLIKWYVCLAIMSDDALSALSADLPIESWQGIRSPDNKAYSHKSMLCWFITYPKQEDSGMDRILKIVVFSEHLQLKTGLPIVVLPL